MMVGPRSTRLVQLSHLAKQKHSSYQWQGQLMQAMMLFDLATAA